MGVGVGVGDCSVVGPGKIDAGVGDDEEDDELLEDSDEMLVCEVGVVEGFSGNEGAGVDDLAKGFPGR